MPICEADMVLQLQLYLAKTGMVNFCLHKMEKNPTANRTWKIAKTCFQKALKDVESINKLTTGEVVITDNEVIKSNTLKIKYALRSRIIWETPSTISPWHIRPIMTPLTKCPTP